MSSSPGATTKTVLTIKCMHFNTNVKLVTRVKYCTGKVEVQEHETTISGEKNLAIDAQVMR